MIDTFSEKIISLEVAANHVGAISGKKRNRSIILRWINRGVAGVRLEAVRIGGEIYTSERAINLFLNESCVANRRRHSQATSAGIRRSSQEIEKEAQCLGI